jgi:translation initiation factor 1
MNLVWSDDPKDKCAKCGKLKNACECPRELSESERKKAFNFVAIFRLEKSGRGGKTVTVIDNLPKQEIFLRDLCKELKNKCGSGGTYLMDGKEGVIEIQGDKRVQIKAIFDRKGFKYKGM